MVLHHPAEWCRIALSAKYAAVAAAATVHGIPWKKFEYRRRGGFGELTELVRQGRRSVSTAAWSGPAISDYCASPGAPYVDTAGSVWGGSSSFLSLPPQGYKN